MEWKPDPLRRFPRWTKPKCDPHRRRRHASFIQLQCWRWLNFLGVAQECLRWYGYGVSRGLCLVAVATYKRERERKEKGRY